MSVRSNRLAAPWLLSLLLAAPFASAQTPSRDIRISGIGIRKCSEWLQWREQQQGEARALALEWASGFIAGHNVYGRNGNDAANSVVAETPILATLLDSYCQKAPESRIVAGVIDITRSLGGVKSQIAPPKTATPPAPSARPPLESGA